MPPITVNAVRHGESEWNLKRLVQGQSPEAGGLTDQGVLEAVNAGARLRALGVTVDEIVSSDLQRAFETAVIIGAALDRPIRIDSSFREQRYGILEGHHFDDVIGGVTVRSLLDAVWDEPDVRPDGGESATEMGHRILDAVSRFENHGEVIVVCHGGPIRALIDLARTGELTPGLRIPVKNGSIATFIVTNDETGCRIAIDESAMPSYTV